MKRNRLKCNKILSEIQNEMRCNETKCSKKRNEMKSLTSITITTQQL